MGDVKRRVIPSNFEAKMPLQVCSKTLHVGLAMYDGKQGYSALKEKVTQKAFFFVITNKKFILS